MLREKVVSGSIILTLRTVAGIAISVVGSIAILRLFDLKTYGLYALATYWVGFFSGFIRFGIHNYIARTQEEISENFLGTAFSLFLGLSIIGTLIVIFLVGPLLNVFYEEPYLYFILCLLSVNYILRAIGEVSLSLLEKDLEYKKLGAIELASQLFFYIPAIAGVLMGYGIFALVIAELMKTFFSSALALFFKRIKFSLTCDRKLSLKILKYGFGITTSSGIYAINGALVPLMVGPIVGTEAVGIIKVTQNIAGQLSFFKSIAWRISIPALGKIQSETHKVIKVVTEGALYQSILVALPLFGFASLGYWLIPLIYGNKWSPVAGVFVLLCLPVVVNSIFSFQASALYAIEKNMDVAKWSSVYTLLLWPTAFLTISYFGLYGLPLAEILVIPTYYFLYRGFKKHFGGLVFRDIFTLLIVSYLFAVIGWLVKVPVISSILFIIPTLVVIFTNKKIKGLILDLFQYFKNGSLRDSLFSFKSG